MTKLSPAMKAAMWHQFRAENGMSYQMIGEKTRVALVRRHLITGTCGESTVSQKLTEAGRDWIAEQIEDARADAFIEACARAETPEEWDDAYREGCRQGLGTGDELIVGDWADAIEIEERQAAADAAFNAPRPYPCTANEATYDAAIAIDADISAGAMKPSRLHITGHLAADIRTCRIAGGQWTEVRVLDNCAYGCKLHGRRVDGFVEYALIHNATYGCPLGRDLATAQVSVDVDGVVVRSMARCQWDMPDDAQPDSVRCDADADADGIHCQPHADLSHEIAERNADHFDRYNV